MEKASETIDFDELSRGLGPALARSVVKGAARFGARFIPDFEDLLVGDVVLSRAKQSLPDWFPSISSFQGRVPRLRDGNASDWTHAMLYVGRLHVAESQKVRGRRPGIAISPLVVPEGTDLLVCRRTGWRDTDEFDEYRRKVALYALTDFAVNRRSYDLKRVASIVASGRGLLERLALKLFPPNFERAIICSEFVLESLAIGGKMLTNEWEALKSGDFFYPGDFFLHAGFEQLSPKYLNLSV